MNILKTKKKQERQTRFTHSNQKPAKTQVVNKIFHQEPFSAFIYKTLSYFFTEFFNF